MCVADGKFPFESAGCVLDLGGVKARRVRIRYVPNLIPLVRRFNRACEKSRKRGSKEVIYEAQQFLGALSKRRGSFFLKEKEKKRQRKRKKKKTDGGDEIDLRRGVKLSVSGGMYVCTGYLRRAG